MVNYCVFLFVYAVCSSCMYRHFPTKLFKYYKYGLFFLIFFNTLLYIYPCLPALRGFEF